MKKFETPEVEVQELLVEDVMTTSATRNPDLTEEDEF